MYPDQLYKVTYLVRMTSNYQCRWSVSNLRTMSQKLDQRKQVSKHMFVMTTGEYSRALTSTNTIQDY